MWMAVKIVRAAAYDPDRRMYAGQKRRCCAPSAAMMADFKHVGGEVRDGCQHLILRFGLGIAGQNEVGASVHNPQYDRIVIGLRVPTDQCMIRRIEHFDPRAAAKIDAFAAPRRINRNAAVGKYFLQTPVTAGITGIAAIERGIDMKSFRYRHKSLDMIIVGVCRHDQIDPGNTPAAQIGYNHPMTRIAPFALIRSGNSAAIDHHHPAGRPLDHTGIALPDIQKCDPKYARPTRCRPAYQPDTNKHRERKHCRDTYRPAGGSG